MATEANREEIIKLMEQAKDSNGQINAEKAAKNLRDAGYANLADQTARRA